MGNASEERTRLTVDPEVQLLGYQSEPMTQEDVRVLLGYYREELEDAYIAAEDDGEAGDLAWEQVGYLHARISDTTRRMIIRRREDRYHDLAARLALALDDRDVPALWVFFLQAGRVDTVAAMIAKTTEPEFAEARALVPTVLAAHEAMQKPAWENTATRRAALDAEAAANKAAGKAQAEAAKAKRR